MAPWGNMDSPLGFGPSSPGSNPGGATIRYKTLLLEKLSLDHFLLFL